MLAVHRPPGNCPKRHPAPTGRKAPRPSPSAQPTPYAIRRTSHRVARHWTISRTVGCRPTPVARRPTSAGGFGAAAQSGRGLASGPVATKDVFRNPGIRAAGRRVEKAPAGRRHAVARAGGPGDRRGTSRRLRQVDRDMGVGEAVARGAPERGGRRRESRPATGSVAATCALTRTPADRPAPGVSCGCDDKRPSRAGPPGRPKWERWFSGSLPSGVLPSSGSFHRFAASGWRACFRTSPQAA